MAVLDPPTCPECGSLMVLKTARRGPNAGNHFWGCPRYPHCRAIVNLQDADTLKDDPSIGPAAPSVSDLSFPTTVVARARDAQSQVTFIQSCALPAALVEAIHEGEIERRLVRSVAQWRLDYPMPHESDLDSGDRDILSVAEALLTRGTTPLCFPSLEQALGIPAGALRDTDSLLQALRRVALAPSCHYTALSFDSDEERSLDGWMRGRLGDEAPRWSILPQTELASLNPSLDPNTAERGDFLLAHPEHGAVLVEVDGTQHDTHVMRDADRDQALLSAGIRVIRVPAAEVRRGDGAVVQELRHLLAEGEDDVPPETGLSMVIRWSKFAHQAQLAILAALRGGWLHPDCPWRLAVALPDALSGEDRAQELLERAVRDFRELLFRLGRLYGREIPALEPTVAVLRGGQRHEYVDVAIGPGDGRIDRLTGTEAGANFLISDCCFPREIKAPLTASSPKRIPDPKQDDARWFLDYLFRKPTFWEGQWETIERSLKGLDSLVLLPTGAGKSIAFQLAALLLPGRCIVVDPIISLIDDQMDNLEKVGIDRCIGITSQLATEAREQALDAFKSAHYLFCYVAPERFQSIPFREALRALTTNTPISLIAIDEAHCVSEWGHDFRTAYLNLGRTSRDYCTSQGMVPPLAALTGTASKIVLKDVQRELGITSFDAIITPKTFDRPELRYTILTCHSSEKAQRVSGFLDRLPTDFAVDRGRFFSPSGRQTYAGLVFCPHVNGEYGVVQQAEQLARSLRIRVDIYSGGRPRNADASTWEQRKRRIARDFKRNRTTVLACTKAFGMGIDKPNIRYTVHIGLPASIESFYQEAGRAGRDRKRAECAIILSNDNPPRSQRLLSPATPLEQVSIAVDGRDRRGDGDDITRALWFHVHAFRGEQAEVQDVGAMLDALGDVQTRRQTNVTWRDPRWSRAGEAHDASRERAEKALHRLVVLGVVLDYTLDHAAQEFGARIAGASQEEIAVAFGAYAGAYQRRLGEAMEQECLALRRQSHRDYILSVAAKLVGFIYQHIEQARRRALNEMLQATMSARTGEDLRRRVLNYLEQSEWDDRLEAARDSAQGGLDVLGPILDDLISPNDAAALRGAVGRLLGSYPDVPGLLLLRAMAEVLSPDADAEVARQNLEAALAFAAGKFRLDAAVTARAVGQAISRACNKEGAAGVLLRVCLASASTDRPFVRELMGHLPPTVASIPAEWLNNALAARCSELVKI